MPTNPAARDPRIACIEVTRPESHPGLTCVYTLGPCGVPGINASPFDATAELDGAEDGESMSDGGAVSLTFDKAKDTWVCPIHGAVDETGWVRCYAGCDDGEFDEYEDDPINNDPGDFSTCVECGGAGGWLVCGQCNADNPDVEW